MVGAIHYVSTKCEKQVFLWVINFHRQWTIMSCKQDICGKTHQIPWKSTIYDHFVKEGIECSIENIESCLKSLVQNGLIENRDAIGNDSFFFLGEHRASQGNNYEDTGSIEKHKTAIKYMT